MDLKEACDSFIEGSYNILIEFGILMKPVRIINMCLYRKRRALSG
jgi:hypothetical protein